MKINKLNYEIFAIDYIDGNLSGDLKLEMEQFLLQHPALAREVELLAMSNPIAPDITIKFTPKDSLKKPVQAVVSAYMNWIIPICVSVAFMVAYPYIRTLWVADTPAVPSNVQPAINNAPSTTSQPLADNSNTSTTHSASADNNNTETPLNNTNNSVEASTNIAIDNQANASSNNERAIASATQVQTANTSDEPITIDANNSDFTADNNLNYTSDIDDNETLVTANKGAGEYDWDDEEKSTVDFGHLMTTKKNRNTLLLNLSDADLLEGVAHQAINNAPLGQMQFKPSNFRPNFVPYLSFSLSPIGLGYDIRTLNNGGMQSTKDLLIDAENCVKIEMPYQFGADLHFHLSPRIAVNSGFYVTNRNLSYRPTNAAHAPVIDLDIIKYRTFSVPVSTTLKIPVNPRVQNFINVNGGVAFNWMGRSDYSAPTGSIENDFPNTAGLIHTTKGDNILISTDDELRFTPALELGVSYEKQIKHAGNISFGISYQRQFANINTIRIWDYNLDTSTRSLNSGFEMRYETITASLKYTLPYQIRLKRVNP